jgi:hypothetical protein
MTQFAAQAAGNHAGVVQVDGQYRVVFLHIRAEEQQRGAVEPVLDPRQITRVVMVGAVGTAAPSDDVAATMNTAKVRPCLSVRRRRSWKEIFASM